MVLLATSWCFAQASVQWSSPTTGSKITGRLLVPDKSDDPRPTVVYLQNLSIPRIGLEADEAILADLVAAGHLVLVLDYAHHPRAKSPDLAADFLKLREDIAGKNKTLLGEFKVDPNRLFLLAEGFRLRRDVEFARDGSRVLAMDIMYPSRPAKPVPVLMEITCDNKDRMGSFSLLYCRDTLLEGAQLAGFAAAMVDHPVAPPYKGLDDPMPQSIERMKRAVKTLHGLNDQLSFNGKVGAIGFSRGGPFAAILAATGDVQAAMIHGNRYDYLDLRHDDPMLARFERAWGPRDTNRDRWAEHGASHYLTKAASPMFLNTSNTESPEYRYGLATFAKRLKELGIDHVYSVEEDDRGHQVSMNPRTLDAAYAFFSRHLRP
jgi:acetyl esterase/lipase